jgi:hypothetical protein
MYVYVYTYQEMKVDDDSADTNADKSNAHLHPAAAAEAEAISRGLQVLLMCSHTSICGMLLYIKSMLLHFYVSIFSRDIDNDLSRKCSFLGSHKC